MFKGKKMTVITLVIGNLIPILGVIYAGWDVVSICLLYWAENLIVGAYNILKMIIAGSKNPLSRTGSVLGVPFFCLHYGGFCGVHGLFLIVLFKIGGEFDMSSVTFDTWPGPLIFFGILVYVVKHLWHARPPEIDWALCALVVSHGVSFVRDFIMKGEYKRTTVNRLMGEPYKRIVIMHIAIIGGAFLIQALGSPVGLLVVLVLLKTAYEAVMAIREGSKKDSKGNDSGDDNQGGENNVSIGDVMNAYRNALNQKKRERNG